MTILDLVAKMGLLPWLVILALALMNAVTLTVGFLKWRRLRSMRRSTRDLGPGFWDDLSQDHPEEAIARARKHPASPVTRVLAEALERAVPLLADPELSDRAVESAERTVNRQQLLIATELKRHLPLLATIGATAPFVGLLGTVIGITNSFVGIASTGGGGIEAVAGGVGEALITTAAGLLVAIPALWLYNYFITRLEELFSELAFSADELIDWLALHRSGVAMRYDTPLETPLVV